MWMAGVVFLSRVGRFNRSYHGLANSLPILQTAPQCPTAELCKVRRQKKIRLEGRKAGYLVIQIAFASWRG
jgi:hypothetical protein